MVLACLRLTRHLPLLLALIFGLGPERTLAQVRVVVASEPWSRVIYSDHDGVPRGPLVDLIEDMNQVQKHFRFEILIVPRMRLDSRFMDKTADVYPLRTTAWTAPELGLLATRTLLTSGDVYIARRDNPNGGRAVFKDLPRRSIAGVRGYHYRLFDNNPDEAYITSRFKAQLLTSNESVLKFVQAGHADVGIVPEAIMAMSMADPALREQLIVGDVYDSKVELSNLVRRDGPISVAEMNEIVEALVKNGAVGKLKSRLNLKPVP